MSIAKAEFQTVSTPPPWIASPTKVITTSPLTKLACLSTLNPYTTGLIPYFHPAMERTGESRLNTIKGVQVGDSVIGKESLPLRYLVQLLPESWQFQIWCSMTKAGVGLLRLPLSKRPMSRLVKYIRSVGIELSAAAIKYTQAKLFSPGAYGGMCRVVSFNLLRTSSRSGGSVSLII